MVHVEVSIALPLIAGALFEARDWKKRKGPRSRWDGDKLLGLD